MVRMARDGSVIYFLDEGRFKHWDRRIFGDGKVPFSTNSKSVWRASPARMRLAPLSPFNLNYLVYRKVIDFSCPFERY